MTPPFGGDGPALGFSEYGAGKVVSNTGKCNRRVSSRTPNHEQGVRAADSPPARKSTVARLSRPLRVVVKPSTGGKWSAELDGEVLCVASAPLVVAARVLVNKGADPDYIIEAWRLGSDTWALRGRLGVIANIRLDGERRASHSARNGSPVDSQGEGAL
jgi:hypothetical protein